MSTQPLILVADDEPRITKLVSIALSEEGFRVVTASGGEEALAKAEEVRPDIVLLDIVMPDLDGIEVMRQLRERRPVPVILLTAKGSTADKAKGLDLGADDYVAKPFEPRELVARIKAVLRRRSAPAGDRGGDTTVEFAGWRFDRLKRQLVSPQQVVVPLSSAEYRLLSAFVERPRRVLTRDQLLDATRGQGVVVADRAIDLAVSRLRQKLSAAQDGEQLICTIRGEGYIFDAEVR